MEDKGDTPANKVTVKVADLRRLESNPISTVHPNNDSRFKKAEGTIVIPGSRDVTHDLVSVRELKDDAQMFILRISVDSSCDVEVENKASKGMAGRCLPSWKLFCVAGNFKKEITEVSSQLR